ncbi:hypothetical protein KAT51_01010 [bacterium]|nr:hypothetical protein [bacterium]
MRAPKEGEIIEEVETFKIFMKSLHIEFGVPIERRRGMTNRINKILRMLKNPVRRVDINFKSRR